MIDWLVVGKAIVGPAAKTAAKPAQARVKQVIFGREHEAAIGRICSRSLHEVVGRYLGRDTPKQTRDHIESVLELILNKAAADGILGELGQPEAIARVMEHAKDDSSPVDPQTLGVELGALVAAFMAEVSVQLADAAKQHESPLFEYATGERLAAIQAHLAFLREDWLRFAPPSPSTMLVNASRLVEHEIARRLNEEPGRATFITSGAHARWQDFANSNWRLASQKAARSLAHFCRDEPAFVDLADQLDGIGWDTTFEVLWSAFRELPLRHALGHLATLITQVPALDAEQRERYAAARKHARWLLDQAERPRFGRCLLITGVWGAGKSRLLAEMAREQMANGELAVFLGPGFTGSVRAELLRATGELLGWRPNDLGDLCHLLEKGLNTRLFVLVDDLGAAVARQPDLLGEIQALIAECTRTDAIWWVASVDAPHLDYLLSADRAPFWIRYGYAPPRDDRADMVGWLDLDVINAREQVGLKLLERAPVNTNRADLADLSEIRHDAAQFVYEARLLCNPLPAWLRLEVSDEDTPAGLVNVYLARFVSAYWERRKAALALAPGQATELELVVTLLALRLAAARGPAVRLDKLLADAQRLPQLTPELVLRAVAVLASGGIIERHSVGDVLVGMPMEELWPKQEVFWGYRIAQVLLGQIPDADKSASRIFGVLRPWGLRAGAGDWIAEAVTEFGLALLPWRGRQALETRAVWESWYQDSGLASHPLWLAGVTIPGFAQRRIRDWLKHSLPEVTSKRELFLLLRLLSLAACNEWPAQQRLEVMRSYYRLIGDSGLGIYLAHAVSAILHRRDLTHAKDFAQVLAALAGSEQSGTAAILAETAIQVGWDIVGSDTPALLTSVVAFLQRSTMPAHVRDFPNDPGPDLPAATVLAPADLNSTPAYFFWQHLTRTLCRNIAERYGVGAFSYLRDAQWFPDSPSEIASHVAFRMRQEANVALGAVFRNRRDVDPATKSEFLALVDDLARGRALSLPRLTQQEIAFFLIRHTTITGGRPAVIVDKSLWPTLRALCHDKQLQGRIRSTLPTCALNGCEEC